MISRTSVMAISRATVGLALAWILVEGGCSKGSSAGGTGGGTANGAGDTNGTGGFSEGAVMAGETTDATDDAIQKSIVTVYGK